MNFQTLTRPAALVLTLLLAACGGGSKGDAAVQQSAQVGEIVPASYAVSVNLNLPAAGAVVSNVGGIACGANTGNTCTALFDTGSAVTLTATPQFGYVFSGWSGAGLNCPGTGACTVTVDRAHSVTASFSAAATTQNQLDVVVSGSGTVTANSGSLNCPGTCVGTYPANTTVVLTAQAAPGYQLSGWSINGVTCSAASMTCSVPMSTARSATVTFAAISRTVSVSVSGASNGGTVISTSPANLGISCPGGTCAVSVSSGTSVTLSAQAANGYQFSGWGGDCASAGTSATCSLSVTANKAVSASFAAIPANTLSVAVASGSGTITSGDSLITCSSSTACTRQYAPGTSVSLTASPATNYQFSGWTGACSGTGSCTVTMDSAKSVGATFVPVTYTLSVSKNGSGTVASTSPASPTINCGATCAATYNAGTAVTLTATPAAGYTFSGWSGACTGTGSCAVSMTDVKNVTATFTATPVAAAGAPQVLYTDIVSGPNTGGENNKGIYLSIFGKNFGSSGLGSAVKVYINNVEVDNYRFLGPSKGRPDIQQITVQVGALGNPAPGTPLPIKVTVNGVASNTDKTFTVNPGRILFVDNVSGSDSSGVVGDISKPFRHVQGPTTSSPSVWWGVGARTGSGAGNLKPVGPGDFIVMRGRGASAPWTDVGFENYFMRVIYKSGSAPTGASGTGPITLMGYPGEDVYIRGTLAAGMTGGCISGVNGQARTGEGQWFVVTNLRIDCEGYDGPISQQIWGHNWRVVNNDLAASTAPRTGPNIPRMAGITGNGNNAFWYGNHIHDIQGSSGECHGIYIDGDGSYDIAYNYIHDIRDGNGLNAYANGGNGSDVIDDINMHHNLIHNVSKHGFNIADGSRNNIQIWNNVVYNVAYAAVRFNTVDLSGAKIFNNTFYNTNTAKNSAYGALTNDWRLPSGSVNIQNNIFFVASGTPYIGGTVEMSSANGTFAKNIWFGGSGSPSFDSSAITSNPLFVAAGSDFHLQASSPAVGAAARPAAVTSLVTTDFDLNPRGTTMDIGAYQR